LSSTAGTDGRPPGGDAGTRTVAASVAGVLVWSRYLIIGFWLAVTVASVTLLPSITQTRAGSGVDGFVPSDSATINTEIRAFEQFGFPLLSRTVIVQHDPRGLPLSVQAEAVQRGVNVVQGDYSDIPLLRGALPVPNTLGLFPSSREPGTTVLTCLFTPPWAGFSEQYEAAEQLVAGTTGPSDAVVGVTGSIPARVEQGRIVEESLPFIEVATVAAIVLITGVVFRSLIAPLLTVVVGGIALFVTVRAAPLLAGAVGVTVPSELEPLYVALVLGVTTDYVIFFLSALRTELGGTDDRLAAARSATADVAPIVAVAGLTVAAGTGALLVARSDLFRAFGPGMALAVLVGMLVSITLTPALLALLGRAALWPATPRAKHPSGRLGQQSPVQDADPPLAGDRRAHRLSPRSWVRSGARCRTWTSAWPSCLPYRRTTRSPRQPPRPARASPTASCPPPSSSSKARVSPATGSRWPDSGSCCASAQASPGSSGRAWCPHSSKARERCSARPVTRPATCSSSTTNPSAQARSRPCPHCARTPSS
jgi:uncharacterized membrane protein YdfJ with MMPL/SSD domain